MTRTFRGEIFEDMNGHEFLHETATLIRRGWCWDADARDPDGTPVAASDPAATAWSLMGAIVRVSEQQDAELGALSDALWGISGVIPDASLDGWNNAPGRSQAETLAMLDAASTSLTQEPPPGSSAHLN